VIAGTEHGCALVLQKYFDNSPGDFFDSVDRAVQRGNAGLALASLGAVLTRAEPGAHLSAVVQSSLWSSLLSSLKFGQEPAPFVLGLWVVNLLLPHVTAALAPHLEDLLFILQVRVLVGVRAARPSTTHCGVGH
jgi:hypothetical protein